MQTLDWGQSLRKSGPNRVLVAAWLLQRSRPRKESPQPRATSLARSRLEVGLEGGRERRRGRRAALLGWWGGEVPGNGAVGAGGEARRDRLPMPGMIDVGES
jgi:hypothetical protein